MKNQERRLIKYPVRLYCIICIILSVTATIVCVANINNVPASFSNLWLLPFGNALVSLFFYWQLFKGDFVLDFPAIIVTALFTIRNAFTPWVMARTTCVSRLGIASSTNMVTIGIVMFIFETIVVLSYSIYRTRDRKKQIKKIVIRSVELKGNVVFHTVLIFGVVISVVSFIALPELRTQYYTIFTNDMTNLAKEYVTYAGGGKRALSTVSNIVIEAVRLTLSSYLIYKIRQKKESWGTYFLSIGIILLQFFFMNDSNAYILMLVVTLFVLIIKLYPDYAKRTMRYLIVGGVLFGILLYINRFSLDIYGKSLSVFLQAYLPGLNNFASIESILNRSLLDIVRQIFIDLYAAVPFRSTLFGYSGGLVSLPTLWGQANGLSGQILPNIAQSYYYFGPLLAPVLSIFLVSIGINSYEKSKKTDNPCLYTVYVYLAIYACVSITMYDTYIFMCNLLSRVLFMWLFACSCKNSFSQIEGSER